MRVPAHAAVAATVDLAAATVGQRVTRAGQRRAAPGRGPDLDGWVDRLEPGVDRPTGPRHPTRPPPLDRRGVRRPAARRRARAGAGGRQREPGASLAVRPGLARRRRARRRRGSGRAAGRRSRPSWAGNPADLPRSAQGRAGVQDEGSQLVAWGLTRAGGRRPGRWLDLCAGPGGKSALLTGLARPRRQPLLAAEISPHRAALVAGAAPGYPSPAPRVVVADGDPARVAPRLVHPGARRRARAPAWARCVAGRSRAGARPRPISTQLHRCNARLLRHGARRRRTRRAGRATSPARRTGARRATS